MEQCKISAPRSPASAPAIRLPEFLIGVAAGRFFTAQTYTPQHAGPLSILALAAVPLGILATTHAPYTMRFDGLIAPAWVLLIVMPAWGRGPLAVLLGTRPLVALGDVSYGIYILHWPIHDLLTQQLWPWGPKSGGPIFVIYAALCCSAAFFARPKPGGRIGVLITALIRIPPHMAGCPYLGIFGRPSVICSDHDEFAPRSCPPKHSIPRRGTPHAKRRRVDRHAA